MTTERNALVDRVAQQLDEDLEETERDRALREFSDMVNDIADRYGEPFAVAVMVAMLTAMEEDPDGFLGLPPGEALGWFRERIAPEVWAEGQHHRAREGRVQ